MSAEAYREFRQRLRQLEREGSVYRQRKGRYGTPSMFALVVGRVDVIRSGDGFVIPEEPGSEDIYVPARRLGSAVEGDRVVARVERRRPGRNPEGRVVRVLERSVSRIVGTYHRRRGYGIVVSQEPVIRAEVFVPATLAGDAADGDVVQVFIREWGDDELRPVGEVERTLGRPRDPGVDVLSIIIGHQLPLEFPDPVEREADRVARRGIRPEDLDEREDLRDLVVFTIDPADARDHDDALSLRPLPDGSLEVGIHIADVSYYVKQGSALDREAQERGTSVYLVDRAIPMLPEPLSSGLCSLVPLEDRLTLSLLVRLDSEGVPRDHRLVRGVIRSRCKLSYVEAQEALALAEAGGPSADPETSGVGAALAGLARVSRGVRRRRTEAGAIDFAIPEAEVLLDERGSPTEIRPRPRLEAHRIVEDLMILANESVARWGGEAGLPLVYRIHEEPDEDKIDGLRGLAAALGYTLAPGRVTPADLSRLVGAAEGTPHAFLISTVALRSMRQARYSTRNVGHFGLASRAYVHFTSPIRRYPDLLVHRAVVRRLVDRHEKARVDIEDLEATARHSSQRERVAESAERDSVESKKIQYMQQHVGDEFTGTISGVTSFGIFVLLDGCFVEGLTRVSSLLDDYYSYDEDGYALAGRRTRRRLRLGDRVRVRVARVDTETRQVDLELRDGPLDPDQPEG